MTSVDILLENRQKQHFIEAAIHIKTVLSWMPTPQAIGKTPILPTNGLLGEGHAHQNGASVHSTPLGSS